MQMTGADIIIECLIEEGVDTVFGYPGGQVIPLYDAIYKNKGRIRHILTAHEQGASHAADGYARSTGKVGVCIATSGPGATNLVTGLATAYMDSSPVVAITGNVPRSLLGKDSFQEVDITGVTMPITKHNFIVKDPEELADTVREAFRIAASGRPGPVLVDVPKDLQTMEIEYQAKPPVVPYKKVSIKEEDLNTAVKMIKASKAPLCYIGGGIIRGEASKELLSFLEKIDAPVCSSLMALGAVPSKSPRFTGMVGMHGTRLSNLSVNECDLLIVIGARFSDRVISKGSAFANQAKVLHIDIDPAEFNKNIKTQAYIAGDVKEILKRLNERFETPLQHTAWMERIAQNRRRYPTLVASEAKRAKEIIGALDKVLTQIGGAFVATEVGQHQMWAAQFLDHTKPRHFLTSGGLGTMGFGTGAAIGAQVANPGKRVVNIAGDGSFRMNCNELATISRYQLPVVILVFNNHCLGMVRQWQNLFFQQHYSETTLDTPLDWITLASAYGVDGMRLTKEDDPESVLTAAFSLEKPVVVDCEIPLDDKVFPMVAPGASISDMIGFVDEEEMVY